MAILTRAHQEVQKIRPVFQIVAVLAFIFTEMGRNDLRSWVKNHGVNDLDFTDRVGNQGD